MANQRFKSCSCVIRRVAPEAAEIKAVVTIFCPQSTCEGDILLPPLDLALYWSLDDVKAQRRYAQRDYQPGGRLEDIRGVCQTCGCVGGLVLDDANYVLNQVIHRIKDDQPLTWSGEASVAV
ncbi:MAG TPA: hypothetical protein VK963_03150 [Candidatus Saccharimonadales bacterium]|nr:hypothetical protein [Candidatus Saccharimonadales bacterium]